MTKIKISIIGLGYVGLPLALSLGKHFEIIGYDLNKQRIDQLKKHKDINKDLKKIDFKQAKKIQFVSDKTHLKNANIYIVTVPTPINKFKKPDLSIINNAITTISSYLTKGDTIIIESTVYPGYCETIVPKIIQKKNKGLIYNKDYFIGYSPERINPGDKKHKIENISKIISGSNLKTIDLLKKIYKKIIKAEIFVAKSIKVAEAAKVIENAQRDINIAFVNELSYLFNRMNIRVDEVLDAASSKWNFLNFKPGFVGGHCVAVDPYYLTHISKKFGIDAKFLLRARSINEFFYKHVFQIVKSNLKKKSKILIMGITFKENCPDMRNSQITKLIKLLKKHHLVDVYDPIANSTKIELINNLKSNFYDAILLCVNHKIFIEMGYKNLNKLLKNKGIIFDIKNVLENKKNIIKL